MNNFTHLKQKNARPLSDVVAIQPPLPNNNHRQGFCYYYELKTTLNKLQICRNPPPTPS